MAGNSLTALSKYAKEHSLENYILVWLIDTNAEELNENFGHYISELRHMINFVKIFDHIDDCIDYLNELKNERVLLILSDDLAESLIPAMENILSLEKIYIHTRKSIFDQSLMTLSDKVQGTFIEFDVLRRKLRQNIRQVDFDSTTFTVISSSVTIDQINELDQSFMYSQLLKEILLKIEYDEQTKNDFIEFCSNYYQENQSTLNLIEEFRKNYDKSLAIQWYTRPCFLYSMLNQALRTVDLEIILKMGFFIRDLHQQLEQLHSNNIHSHSLTIFRGQGMYRNDFQRINQNIGGLISFNQFLSTTSDESLANFWAESSQCAEEKIGVVFYINIDPSIPTVPFASLAHVSYVADEEKEILFSMHTVFRIVDVIPLSDQLWKIHLESTRDTDDELKRLTDYFRQELGRGSTWDQLGHLLLKMGDFDRAEDICRRLIDSNQDNQSMNNPYLLHNIGFIMVQKGQCERALSYYQKVIELVGQSFPIDFVLCQHLHHNLGDLYQITGDYIRALSYYEKSIEFQRLSGNVNQYTLGRTYYSTGLVYRYIGEYSKASDYFEKALQFWQSTLPSNHPEMAAIHCNIGELNHLSTGDLSTALIHCQKALNIQQKFLPPFHFNTSTSLASIGALYQSLGQYALAIEYYNKALEITGKTTSDNHFQCAHFYNAISEAYRSMGDYTAALSNGKKSLEIFQRSRRIDHPDLALIYNTLGLIYRSIGSYSIALEYFDKAIDIWSKAHLFHHHYLGYSYNNKAELYHTMGKYSEAITCYSQTLQIWRKSLKSDHPDMALLYNNFAALYQSMGNYSISLNYYQQALEIWKNVLTNDHIHFTILYNNMGEINRCLEQHSIALDYYNQALQIAQKSLPSNHCYFAVLHNNIGLVHKSSQKYSEAYEHLQLALQIRQNSLPADHSDIAISHNNIGELCRLSGELKTALEHFEKGLDIQQRSSRFDDHLTAVITNNIGLVYESKDDKSTALNYVKKSLKIWQKILPSDHPDLGLSHYNIGMIHRSMNENTIALQYFQIALNSWRKSLPRNHSYLMMCHNTLAQVILDLNQNGNSFPHAFEAIHAIDANNQPFELPLKPPEDELD